jgi:hypothetical protein
MKKRLCVVLMSVLMLFGLGSSLAPAKAAPAAVKVNSAAPACLKLYVINWGFCWYGMH